MLEATETGCSDCFIFIWPFVIMCYQMIFFFFFFFLNVCVNNKETTVVVLCDWKTGNCVVLSVSVSGLSLSLCLYISVSVCLSVFVCLCFSLCVSLSQCARVRARVCVCARVCSWIITSRQRIRVTSGEREREGERGKERGREREGEYNNCDEMAVKHLSSSSHPSRSSSAPTCRELIRIIRAESY